ncbi:MAG: hypothetical protein K2X08_06410 [Chlamydiales bacterium]|nr:hypothetical protein [Chlamydiales bacterium]MBY0462563.1 hypothetical protein [Alphaproteobacteria bacterium]
MDSNKTTVFLNGLTERFGVYLDSAQGFLSNYAWMLKTQARAQQLYGFSIDQQDATCIIRSNHPPSPDLEECAQKEKHRMTQKKYKENNALGGLNHMIALEDCLCAIYNLWDEFKTCILKKKGMPDRPIMPIMAYLNDIRDRLTHNRNHPEMGKSKLIEPHPLKYSQYTLPSFAKDQSIFFSSDDLDAIIVEIRKWIQKTQNPNDLLQALQSKKTEAQEQDLGI